MASEEFTFLSLERQFSKLVDLGYTILSCEEYVDAKRRDCLPRKMLVNRVDIDFSCKKARRVREIFDQLGIRGTFFVRLHAPEYNPMDFENYLVLKEIRDSGHEIGYHSEIVDQANIWNESPEECLKRDLEILERLLDIEIKGVASHGGMTGWNNLDFWKTHSPRDFGLLYEAYDSEQTFNLFNESVYVTDSEWTKWKCYVNGVRVNGDTRSIAEHAQSHSEMLYSLIHPDTYFDRHFYE